MVRRWRQRVRPGDQADRGRQHDFAFGEIDRRADRLLVLRALRLRLERAPERRQQVAFTMTHFFAFGRLLVRSDSRAQRLVDLTSADTVIGGDGANVLTYIDNDTAVVNELNNIQSFSRVDVVNGGSDTIDITLVDATLPPLNTPSSESAR